MLMVEVDMGVMANMEMVQEFGASRLRHPRCMAMLWFENWDCIGMAASRLYTREFGGCATA